MQLIPCLAVFACAQASVDVMASQDVVAIDRGWYNGNGNPDDGTGSTPSNYAAGVNRSNLEFRNWFVFDLSAVEGPISSMTLRLGVPKHPTVSNSPTTGGYRSPDASEHYSLTSVGTSPTVLMSGAGGLNAFNDLGFGAIFGSMMLNESQEGTVIDITLTDAAVLSAEAARLAGEFWAIGGRLTTIGFNGVEEFGFAGSHTEPHSATSLSVTVVPAPGASIIIPAMIGILPFRRRQRTA